MQQPLTPRDVHLPLSAGEFTTLIDRLMPASPRPAQIGLAVSGGPDSMALALLAHAWAATHGVTLHAFIVDHALRDTSAAEAETTRQRLASTGIAATVLQWEHAPITSRLHIEARKARYQLLTDACHRQNIQHLWVAHQREDQAETILMRLAKGSGIDGLAGIAPKTEMNGVTIWRPLLSIAKERLIATCTAAKMAFVMDESNASERFARGRLRRVLPLLAAEGLTIDRLLDLGERAAVARDALQQATHAFLATSSSMDETGAIRVTLSDLKAVPRAIAERAIELCLRTVHHDDYGSEYASLSALVASLRADDEMPTRTLHSCLISKSPSTVTVIREFADIASQSAVPGQQLRWDGRWQVEIAAHAPPATYQVKPLGLPTGEVLDAIAPDLRQRVPQGRVRASLPSLWKGGDLIAAPNLNEGENSGLFHASLLKTWPPG